MCVENYITYQKVAAKATRMLSEKKKLGWRKFCEMLSPTTPVSMVWKCLKRFRGAMSMENISSNEPPVWADAFCNRLAPPSAPSREECCFHSSDFAPSHKFDSPFSWEEFSVVLEGLRDSSPGVDGIPYSLICQSSYSAKKYFLSILNCIFASGAPPEEWKNQIVLPILKPGKPSSDPLSYRPIALSCTMSKILEHLIKNRLEWFVENTGILASSQFGFRKGSSTMDSLSTFVTDIHIALSKK